MIVSVIVILAVRDQDWNEIIKRCYPDSVMEEFKKFNASLDDLMPYYKLILPVVNSFSGDTEKF